MSSIINKDFSITNAKNFEQMVSFPLANVYVMIGRSIPWSNTSNSEILDDITVPEPYDTTDYKNRMSRDGILMKKVTGNDLQLVVPRVDWVANTVYVPYEETTNLFSMSISTVIEGGTVNVSTANANTVFANGINLASSTPPLSVSDFIKIGEETKQVVSINASGDFLTINCIFQNSYTDATLYRVTMSSLQYANKFYVRNSKDQVFKCLFNNNDAISNTSPEIAIDGQLPENPFIETPDGYKWKYLYTIPIGLKNKFFTNKYMPVIRDSIAFENAENGRIDIIKIVNGGSGYFAGSTVNNYSIVTVTGDGEGAQATVDILNGFVREINILDGGRNYTQAQISLDDPLQTVTGTPAQFKAVISPQYGHGFDPVRELGASNLMLSIDFQGDIEGNLPVTNDGSDTIRQIAMIKDPKSSNNVVFLTDNILPMYTKIFTSNPPVDFGTNEVVYVGSSFNSSVFSARIVHFDNNENILYVNNISGNVNAIRAETLYQKDNLTAAARVLTVDVPDINIFTGEVLYVENKQKIIRSDNQTETVKLVLEF
jgi:hypothetical protein